MFMKNKKNSNNAAIKYSKNQLIDIMKSICIYRTFTMQRRIMDRIVYWLSFYPFRGWELPIPSINQTSHLNCHNNEISQYYLSSIMFINAQ